MRKKYLKCICAILSLISLLGVVSSCNRKPTPAEDSCVETEALTETNNGNGGDYETGDNSGSNDGDDPKEPPYKDADVFSMKAFDATFMSFNILNDSTPGDRTTQVINYMLNSGVGVICMQEVEKEQYDMIEPGLVEKYETIWYTRDGANDQGLAIAYEKSTWTLVESSRFWLSETPEVKSKGWGAKYYRICVNALLEHQETGARVNVFNVHLDNVSEDARVNGLKLVLEKASQSQYPIFVCGDFNARINSDTYNVISQTLQDAQQTASVSDIGRTYHNGFQYDDYDSTAIDFCFFSKEVFEISEFSICRDRRMDNNSYLSDHYPIKTALKFIYEYEEWYPTTTDKGFDLELDTEFLN